MNFLGFGKGIFTKTPLKFQGRNKSNQKSGLDMDFEEKFVKVEQKESDKELIVSFDPDVVVKKFKNFDYSKTNYAWEK